jgi:hypothetical protein
MELPWEAAHNAQPDKQQVIRYWSSIMLKSSDSLATPVIRFEFLNWLSIDPLTRDQSQSRRIHEPEHLINTIDPMTGRDIDIVTSHPSLEDGNLTIYFETEGTRKAYLDMPLDHPNLHLPYPAAENDDRGG